MTKMPLGAFVPKSITNPDRIFSVPHPLHLRSDSSMWTAEHTAKMVPVVGVLTQILNKCGTAEAQGIEADELLRLLGVVRVVCV